MNKTSLIECIKSGPDGFPLTDAYKKKHRFFDDFIEMLQYFKAHLRKKEYEDIEKKIKTASAQDDQTYLQSMCELIVLYYVMRKFNQEGSFKYEPKYNGGYNPECAFEYGGKIVNIEVKCPNMIKRKEIESHKTLKISFAEQVPPNLEYASVVDNLTKAIALCVQDSEYSGVEVVPRVDNKLKDYLEHSQKKFPSGDNYFNILVITLEITKDLDEWYGYLLGDNGAFTNNSYIQTCYDRVDAVLLCTPVCGLEKWEQYSNVNVLHLEETINLLIFDPRKQHLINGNDLTEKGKFYFDRGIDMFGALTREFLFFQQSLDAEQVRSEEGNLVEERYVAFKEVEICICSEFINNFQNKINY